MKDSWNPKTNQNDIKWGKMVKLNESQSEMKVKKVKLPAPRPFIVNLAMASNVFNV